MFVVRGPGCPQNVIGRRQRLVDPSADGVEHMLVEVGLEEDEVALRRHGRDHPLFSRRSRKSHSVSPGCGRASAIVIRSKKAGDPRGFG